MKFCEMNEKMKMKVFFVIFPALWFSQDKTTKRWIHLLFPSVSDDMEAIPVKQFIKHVSELYSNNQNGFSEDFEVRSSLTHIHFIGVYPVSISLPSQQTPSDFCKHKSCLMWFPRPRCSGSVDRFWCLSVNSWAGIPPRMFVISGRWSYRTSQLNSACVRMN